MNVLDYQSDEYLRYMVLHLVTTWVADVIMHACRLRYNPDQRDSDHTWATWQNALGS